ncbi:MAG: LysR substrate-binding domain-containing protein [Pseudomonadales bacterium]
MADLPPLNSLQTFAIASAKLSFKETAAELNISATAVSHRIAKLEAWLGVKLFHRLTRHLSLTPEGERYSRDVQSAFRQLIDSSDQIKRPQQTQVLKVSSTMSFASNWLAPRLHTFQENFPQYELSLQANDQLQSLQHTDLDIAIRYGEGDYSDCFFRLLFSDYYTAVCTPELADSLLSPADLLDNRLIEYRWSGFNHRDPSWQKWLAAAKLQASTSLPRPRVYSEEHIALSAVLKGEGVALLSTCATAHEIEAGNLVRPFAVALQNRNYYFTCAHARRNDKKVDDFYHWLVPLADAYERRLQQTPQLAFTDITDA